MERNATHMSESLFVKTLQTLTPRGFLEGVTLEVREGRIVALWPKGGAPEGGETLDLSDQWVLPGFVNTHTHAAMNLLRGVADDVALRPWLEEHIFPREARLTEEDVYWGTQLAFLEMIQSGTTTFSDMYFHMDAVARAAREAGLRAAVAPGITGGGEEGRRKVEESVEFFYRWQGEADGRISVFLGPHAPYTCTLDLLEQAAQAASDLGTRVHIHLSETREEVAACRKEYGATPIGLLFETGLVDVPVLGAHLVHLDEDDIEKLGRLNISVAHCPVSNLKLGCGMAPVAAYLQEEVPVGIGTDGAASANTLDMFESMRAAALGGKGWFGDPTRPTASEVLHMASEGGARALGLGEVTGRIQPGLAADFIGVSLSGPAFTPLLDPTSALVYTATAANVRTVVVDGRTLYRDGTYLTLDSEEILARSLEVSEKLKGV